MKSLKYNIDCSTLSIDVRTDKSLKNKGENAKLDEIYRKTPQFGAYRVLSVQKKSLANKMLTPLYYRWN